MKYLLTFLLLASFSFINAQNYKQVEIKTPDQNVIQQIIQLGVDLEHSSFEKITALCFL
jgi:hypothetical protein